MGTNFVSQSFRFLTNHCWYCQAACIVSKFELVWFAACPPGQLPTIPGAMFCRGTLTCLHVLSHRSLFSQLRVFAPWSKWFRIRYSGKVTQKTALLKKIFEGWTFQDKVRVTVKRTSPTFLHMCVASQNFITISGDMLGPVHMDIYPHLNCALGLSWYGAWLEALEIGSHATWS